MTIYEKEFYGRDIPGIKKALERIATALEVIVSDPGDEVEHITESYWPPNPAHDIEGAKEWAKDYLKSIEEIPGDYY